MCGGCGACYHMECKLRSSKGTQACDVCGCLLIEASLGGCIVQLPVDDKEDLQATLALLGPDARVEGVFDLLPTMEELLNGDPPLKPR